MPIDPKVYAQTKAIIDGKVGSHLSDRVRKLLQDALNRRLQNGQTVTLARPARNM